MNLRFCPFPQNVRRFMYASRHGPVPILSPHPTGCSLTMDTLTLPFFIFYFCQKTSACFSCGFRLISLRELIIIIIIIITRFCFRHDSLYGWRVFNVSHQSGVFFMPSPSQWEALWEPRKCSRRFKRQYVVDGSSRGDSKREITLYSNLVGTCIWMNSFVHRRNLLS